jgi:hypothetical protein
LSVGDKKIKLTNVLLESSDFNYNGPSETGSHSHTMTAFNIKSSDEALFKVT